jgi:hypothetical protein
MEKMFAKDLAESTPILWDEWRKRPVSDAVGEWVAHLFFRWL